MRPPLSVPQRPRHRGPPIQRVMSAQQLGPQLDQSLDPREVARDRPTFVVVDSQHEVVPALLETISVQPHLRLIFEQDLCIEGRCGGLDDDDGSEEDQRDDQPDGRRADHAPMGCVAGLHGIASIHSERLILAPQVQAAATAAPRKSTFTIPPPRGESHPRHPPRRPHRVCPQGRHPAPSDSDQSCPRCRLRPYRSSPSGHLGRHPTGR